MEYIKIAALIDQTNAVESAQDLAHDGVDELHYVY